MSSFSKRNSSFILKNKFLLSFHFCDITLPLQHILNLIILLEISAWRSINDTGCFFASGCIRFGDLWVIKDFANCRRQTVSHLKRGIMFNYVKCHLYFCIGYLDLKLQINFFYLQKQSSQACNFIEKETLAQVFSCEFCEISKNTFFLQNTSGGCFCIWTSLD